MNIRSVTYFHNPGYPLRTEFLAEAESFLKETRSRFQAAGWEPQTVRFASPPFPYLLKDLDLPRAVEYAQELESALKRIGYDYISLGPAVPEIPGSYPWIPEIIGSTEITFCAGLLTQSRKGLSLPAVRACGHVVQQLAVQKPDGFANLYFAALGNVPSGSPFFPAAYHSGTGPEFSLALEAADLAVQAFESSPSFPDARQALIALMEATAKDLTPPTADLSRICGAVFGGMDFSLAPYPERDRSLGRALELTGVKSVGSLGSLAAAAFLADSVDLAQFPRVGFSGLMLPLLEDFVLAQRAAEGGLGIKDLLLYSAVCGTGLDTVPLPGDASAEQISAVLFDLGALSLRLDKPLTARLMPIPGKKAGDPTTFDFSYFVNSRILELPAEGLDNFFQGEGYLDIGSR